MTNTAVALIWLVGTVGVCWYVFRTFYVSDYGTRPWLAGGCTGIVLLGCLAAGFYLLVLMAIGSSVTV